MEEEGDDGGLFNIEVSSEDEAAKQSEKIPRDFQSEKDFQLQRAKYRPKVELGELWKSLKLPTDNPSKPESQAILHAIEELYFLRRFGEAKDIAQKALKCKLVDEFRVIVEDYRARCGAKMQSDSRRC